MSKKQKNNQEEQTLDNIIDDIIEDTIEDEEIVEETVEKIDSEDIAKELAELDEGTVPLYNEEKMGRLLAHILSTPAYTGEFKATKSAVNIEQMIHAINSVDKIPDNGIVSISHTKEELELISKGLMRVIQASQHKRIGLTRKEQEEKYTRLDDVKLLLTNEEANLLAYITNALGLLDQSPTAKALDDGEWTNSLQYNDKRIGTALVVSYKDPIKQVRSKLNLMNEAATQLVHSGLVIKIASAGSLDQALLNDNLVAAKIQNSLSTYGTGLDMTSIYIDEILVEHIHRHLIDSNIGDMSKETFEENLSILDLNTLYNAMAISLYPTGFKLYRQCMNQECSNIDEVSINPRRTNLHRDDRITQSSKQHLIKGLNKVDPSAIKNYREELNPNVTKYHEIAEDTFVKFQIPTFAEYKRISKYWLEYLGDKSTDLIRGSLDEDSRQRYIQQAMHKASVMMYAHWIEGIYTRDENGEYVENLVRLKPGRGVSSSAISTVDEKLDTILSDFSLNRDVHNKLVEAIKVFISESTLSLTVLAKSKCTKCNTDYVPEGEDIGDELISYNAGELFFTLLHRKTGEQ